MKNIRSRGFTLIELLVVIAIIGILSAVILASLSTAQSKGNDAAVQSDLSTVQTEAEIYYSGTGSNSYSSPTDGAIAVCTGTSIANAGMFYGDTTIVNALAGAKSNSRGGTGGICGITAAGTAYAVEVPINNGGTNAWWCVDSTGDAKLETTASAAGFTQC